MNYTLEEKYQMIKKSVLESQSKDPVKIAKELMRNENISMHGPEHHFLDGASFLTAFKNAGGEINLVDSLNELEKRTIKMPGAMCGFWGVCGSVTSLGASLSIITKTGPLSANESYKSDMEFTSLVISKMSKIGGPRCCKRNAFLSLGCAIHFCFEHFGIQMDSSMVTCDFDNKNKDCIQERCPFNKRYLGHKDGEEND